jgi:hypothetical protein
MTATAAAHGHGPHGRDGLALPLAAQNCSTAPPATAVPLHDTAAVAPAVTHAFAGQPAGILHTWMVSSKPRTGAAGAGAAVL